MLVLLIFIGFIVYAVNTAKRQPAQQTQPRASTKSGTKPTETKAEYEQRVLAEQRAKDQAKQTIPTPDPTLLQVVNSTWGKGGFDSVAIWRVTFLNRSDKPIGNIRYRTSYTAETGGA